MMKDVHTSDTSADLQLKTNDASSQAVLDRLARIYDEIYVDEVQDLNGYDLVVLEALMASPIELRLVGDIRQALLMTNVRDPKYKQYKGIKIMNWFEAQAARGILEITHEPTTWRSNQAIADFADALFGESWGFARTSSMNKDVTGHDGVFAVAMDDVMQYVARFAPVCLRWDARFGAGLDVSFVNIGVAKGMSVERVLIVPTGTMVEFLSEGKEMTERTCCSLYVAATRARASVAIACADPSQLGLPIWTP